MPTRLNADEVTDGRRTAMAAISVQYVERVLLQLSVSISWAQVLTIKSRKHSDANCLSSAPIDLRLQDEQDEDTTLGTLSADDYAEQQRSNPELRSHLDYLEGKTIAVPRGFRHGLPPFCLQDGVLVKNFWTAHAKYLLIVPSVLHPEVLQAMHSDGTAGRLGFSHMLATIQNKYY